MAEQGDPDDKSQGVGADSQLPLGPALPTPNPHNGIVKANTSRGFGAACTLDDGGRQTL